MPFAAIALGLVLTPGPNMIYLLSRTVCQGRRAGLVSLSGVVLGFLFYMTAASYLRVAVTLRPFSVDFPLSGDVIRTKFDLHPANQPY